MKGGAEGPADVANVGEGEREGGIESRGNIGEGGEKSNRC